MKQLPYIQTSTAIIGYSDSLIAKSETNDCFVRAVASAYDISYDKAHEWVRKYFKRKNNKGTSNVVLYMELFSIQKKVLNGKRSKSIQELRSYDSTNFKMKRTTLNQFIKKHSTGTYIIIVKGHAFTLKDGSVIGNQSDSKSLKKIVHNAFEIC